MSSSSSIGSDPAKFCDGFASNGPGPARIAMLGQIIARSRQSICAASSLRGWCPPREIAARRRAQGFAEHRDEGARALIAEVERDDLDGDAALQPLQRQHDLELLPPADEGHARL